MADNLNVNARTYGTIDQDPIAHKDKLVDHISSNIHKLLESLNILKRYIPKIGTKNDNFSLRESVQKIESTNTNIVKDTHKKVQELLRIVKKLDKQSQLRGRTLSEQFREVVNEYNTVQQEFSMKIKYAPLPKNIEMNQFDDDGNVANANKEDSYLSEMIVQHNLELERDVTIDRQIRMQQIEEDVIDVNQIMKEINAMVNQQGESIVSIEDAIDRTGGDIESGTQELFTAYERQRRKRIRKLMCWSVILVILVIVVLYVVLS